MSDQKITISNGKLVVPENPTIPYIEGDGTGVDIWPASRHVFDAAVQKAYNGKRKINWKEVLAGEKSFKKLNNWLPEETLNTFREYLVGIKGPLTTPVGGGIRSLNVALRQELDLYACVRPVRWFKGVPSPVKEPQKTDMVLFRETPRISTLELNFRKEQKTTRSSSSFLKRLSQKIIKRSVSRKQPASGSNPFQRKVLNALCAPPWSSPWRTRNLTLRWFTKATS